MDTFPLEKFLDKGNGVYTLCLLAAKRAIMLNRGAPSLIQEPGKVTTLALEEIIQGKIRLRESAD